MSLFPLCFHNLSGNPSISGLGGLGKNLCGDIFTKISLSVTYICPCPTGYRPDYIQKEWELFFNLNARGECVTFFPCSSPDKEREPSNSVLEGFIELGKRFFTVLTCLFFLNSASLDLTGDYTLRVHPTSLTPSNPHCFTHK